MNIEDNYMAFNNSNSARDINTARFNDSGITITSRGKTKATKKTTKNKRR